MRCAGLTALHPAAEGAERAQGTAEITGSSELLRLKEREKPRCAPEQGGVSRGEEEREERAEQRGDK